MAQTTSVLWSVGQGLGEDAKAQARQNIGAASEKLTEVVNNHTEKIEANTTEIGQIKVDVADIESSLLNKKDKQLEYYNAGVYGSGTKVTLNDGKNDWLPLANANNTYNSYKLKFNPNYKELQLDPNKKYLCVAEIRWEVGTSQDSLANTIAKLDLSYEAFKNKARPKMLINVDMTIPGEYYQYISWLTEGLNWTGIFAGLSNAEGKSVDISVEHFFAIEQ